MSVFSSRQKPPPVSGFTAFLVGLAFIFAYYQYKSGRVGRQDIYYFAVLIPSVILHEISHGALANIFGDRTAKDAGRLTLNPLRHVDPLGTIILPGLLILTNNPAFGYAKPVPVNTTHMSRNKAMFVGLVGPATNVVIALLMAVIINLVWSPARLQGDLIEVLFLAGYVNIVLAVFNMIPIPPLDGSSVVERFLPDRYMNGYYKFRQYSMFLLVILALNSQNTLGRVFTPFVHQWVKLLPFGVG